MWTARVEVVRTLYLAKPGISSLLGATLRKTKWEKKELDQTLGQPRNPDTALPGPPSKPHASWGYIVRFCLKR